MIVRFGRPGTSFKGVTVYLMHDPDHAATAERVAWTQTLNCAHDHIESAVHEMLTTCENADLLKAEAGIRGGASVEKPVKHVSLNWHPSEEPTRKDMVTAATSFLKHMGWADHQAILVAHDDKEHLHVHLVINAVNPDTGRKLDDGFEKRRAQAWALAYEQEHGKIFCPERMKDTTDRAPAVPRPAWIEVREQVQKELSAERQRIAFDPGYLARDENRLLLERREWELLKAQQKEERLAFFADGKALYGELNRAVYREIREEFRGEWAEYFAARRAGGDPGELAERRADLIARQKETIGERREQASAVLRAARDGDYRALLDAQKDERGELAARQELGLRSPMLLDRAYPAPERIVDAEDADLAAALDRFGVRRGRSGMAAEPEPGPFAGRRGGEQSGETPGGWTPSGPPGPPLPGPGRDLASGLAGGLLSILGGIGESLTGGHGPPAVRRRAEPDPLDRFAVTRGRPPPDAAAEKAKRDREEREAWDAWQAKRELDRSRSGW